MIIIFSQRVDTSTNLICSYLLKEDISFVRINAEDDLKIHALTISNEEISLKLQVNGQIIDFSNIKTIWYRNCYLFKTIVNRIFQNYSNNHQLLKYHDTEISVLNDYIFFYLEKKGMIGNFSLGSPNKLIVLYQASLAGLQIPYTLITTEKESLQLMLEKQEVIIKPIKDSISVLMGKNYLQPFTRSINTQSIDALPSNFFPAKFQRKIIPIFELRIFFIEDEFYSMAIFSTESSKSEIADWRYRQSERNRYVPYKLPFDVKRKLKMFLTRLRINSGSIDMIVTSNYEYYFLEVNPTGQFNFLSTYTNHFIEKAIVQKLICHEKE